MHIFICSLGFLAENIYIQQSATVTGGSTEDCSCVSHATKAKPLELGRGQGGRNGASSIKYVRLFRNCSSNSERYIAWRNWISPSCWWNNTPAYPAKGWNWNAHNWGKAIFLLNTKIFICKIKMCSLPVYNTLHYRMQASILVFIFVCTFLFCVLVVQSWQKQ